jgi:hypothetical protein
LRQQQKDSVKKMSFELEEMERSTRVCYQEGQRLL